ncbi:MAG: hypothetical protein RIC56_11210 [Pseudomonadales bacterium]
MTAASRVAHPAVLTAALVMMLLLGACTGMDLEPSPPPQFDLSGRWVLLEDASDDAPTRRVLRARGGMLSFVTQDFPVLRAREMRIEQSRDSMGVRYDEADYRDVSWGTRKRGLWEVRAGWSEGRLIIISDARDADGQEIFTLSPDGRRLTVDVRVVSSGDDVNVTRVFERR